MTLRNHTSHPAQFVVHRGQQVIGRFPAIAPGELIELPAGSRYVVAATTVFEGRTYTSDQVSVDRATAFLAQMRQQQEGNGIEVVEVPGQSSTRFEFQSALRTPVSFTISKQGRPLQSIAVNDQFQVHSLDIGETFDIHAVIDGVMTATTTTANPSAVITAIEDDPLGYFVLDVA